MSHVPKSVLTAVDFGDASGRAVALSGVIAERCHVPTFRLLHAETMDAPAYFTTDQIEALERQRRNMRAQAERFLSTFGREHTPGPFSTLVDDRSPVDAILQESADADLVVMGTHGRHGPKRWWLGSVAERVLREVARPLLIVRSDGADSVESLFDRVLVHASTPLVGASTLAYAREFAACCGGTIIDGRHEPIESALFRARATLLVVAAPQPRTAAWLSNGGEPLVRCCKVPILFVPEFTEGASS
jgi:nucleotide-binding universal stress UspA family protein